MKRYGDYVHCRTAPKEVLEMVVECAQQATQTIERLEIDPTMIGKIEIAMSGSPIVGYIVEWKFEV